MMAAPSIELEVIGKQRVMEYQLKGIPLNELEEFVKGYNSSEDGKKKRTILDLVSLPTDSDFFRAMAAGEIISDRHGHDYLLNVLGLRKPRTIKENVRYFFTRQYPKK